MFVFEDLDEARTPAACRRCCARSTRPILALALKGASDALRQLFFSNMSERAAKLLKEDMAAMGPVRLKDVDAAQTRMVAHGQGLVRARRNRSRRTAKAEDELIY